MKYLFESVEHRKKLNGTECDIYIPELKLGIEVDGLYWHKDKYIADEKKMNLLKDKGIVLIRVREEGLKRVSEDDILFSTKNIGFTLMRSLSTKILELTNMHEDLSSRVREYLKKGRIANNDNYIKLLNMLPAPLLEFSLKEKNPILAKEWHPTKNGSLTPRDVASFCMKKVWWRCNRGHEWEAIVGSRSSGNGCPYCAGQAVCDDNCLQTLNPALAKEWHPTKNDNLTPKNVTPGSDNKVWWRCNRGHEWEATIANRSRGSGCPYCAGQAVCDDNCLQTINPTLTKEWHPTKNGSLTPREVTPFSNKKVWWKCNRGHEWEAKVYNRSNGSGCPYCAGRTGRVS